MTMTMTLTHNDYDYDSDCMIHDRMTRKQKTAIWGPAGGQLAVDGFERWHPEVCRRAGGGVFGEDPEDGGEGMCDLRAVGGADQRGQRLQLVTWL